MNWRHSEAFAEVPSKTYSKFRTWKEEVVENFSQYGTSSGVVKMVSPDYAVDFTMMKNRRQWFESDDFYNSYVPMRERKLVDVSQRKQAVFEFQEISERFQRTIRSYFDGQMHPIEFATQDFKKKWQQAINIKDPFIYATDHHDNIFEEDSVTHISRLHDVLSFLDNTHTGFNTPGLFFNKDNTVFPIHIDGHNLSTINICLNGSAKLWMFVNPANIDIIKQYMAENVKNPEDTSVEECQQFFVHRQFLIDPWKAANKILKDQSNYPGVVLPLFYYTIQKENEALLFFPNVPHMGVNTGDGVSMAIAVSYALGFQTSSRFSCRHESPWLLPQEELKSAMIKYLKYWRNPTGKKIDREQNFFSKRTEAGFKCECKRSFKPLGGSKGLWRQAQRHCRRCPSFIYPVTIEKWYLHQDSKKLDSAERKTLSLHPKSETASTAIPLTQEEEEALRRADEQQEQQEETPFIPITREFCELYPEHYYTMFTGPIEEEREEEIEEEPEETFEQMELRRSKRRRLN